MQTVRDPCLGHGRIDNGIRRGFTVGIDIPFHPIFTYLAANSKNYFSDSKKAVEFKTLNPATQLAAFRAGELDVIATVPSLLPVIKERYGIDVSYFYPLARWTPGPQLLVPEDSDVQSIDDLAGKSIAIASLSSRWGAEQAAVAAFTGETIGNYFALRQTDTAALLLTLGHVDGAFLEAPDSALLLKRGYRAVFSVQDAFEKAFDDPAVVNGGFIARKNFIQQNLEFVNELVTATTAAWLALSDNPGPVLKEASRISKISPSRLEQVSHVLNLAKPTDEQKRITDKDILTWSRIFPLLQLSGFTQVGPLDPSALFLKSPISFDADTRIRSVGLDLATLDDHRQPRARQSITLTSRLSRGSVTLALRYNSPEVQSWLVAAEMLLSDPGAVGRIVSDSVAPEGIENQVLVHLSRANLDKVGNSPLLELPETSPALVRRAIRIMEQHAHEPLTVSDIAECLGVSSRSLQNIFRRYLETTPMERLRDIRMVRAREELVAADPARTTVTKVATRWGFHHLGRFSVEFRRRFGESPSSTLRR